MDNKKSRNQLRKVRHRRVRGRVEGTQKKPRLSVFFSLKYVYAQLVDDEKNQILSEANSLKLSRKQPEIKGKLNWAEEVGKKIAQLAKEKGIKKVVFDRGGYKYHGKVKTLAESARKNGLSF